MPQSNVYTGFDAPQTGKRTMGETAQIVLLAGIILVFGAIAASSVLGLVVSVMHH